MLRVPLVIAVRSSFMSMSRSAFRELVQGPQNAIFSPLAAFLLSEHVFWPFTGTNAANGTLTALGQN
jgi:hypothetical protein